MNGYEFILVMLAALLVHDLIGRWIDKRKP